MAMFRKVPIGPQHARVPEALPAFLLVPDRPPVYRWWRRLFDQWAGMRDRTPAAHAPSDEIPTADSPWLQRLLSECGTAIAVGRTRTDALVAILDKEIAQLRAEEETLTESISALGEERDDVEGTELDPGIVGVGEQYSPRDERLRRRQLQKAGELSRLDGQRTAAQGRLRSIRQEIGILEQERRSHWSVFQERTRLLTEYYQRRAGSYTRGLERRRRRMFFVTPTVTAPDWAVADLGTGGIRETAPVLALVPSDDSNITRTSRKEAR